MMLREEQGDDLLIGHAVSGVQEAWLSFWLLYGTWEPGRRCQGKRRKRLLPRGRKYRCAGEGRTAS